MSSYQVPVRYGPSRALKPATAAGPTPGERCDGCHARAYVFVARDLLRLALCAHHFGRLEQSLRASGWDVEVDERHLLTGERSIKVSVAGGSE